MPGAPGLGVRATGGEEGGAHDAHVVGRRDSGGRGHGGGGAGGAEASLVRGCVGGGGGPRRPARCQPAVERGARACYGD